MHQTASFPQISARAILRTAFAVALSAVVATAAGTAWAQKSADAKKGEEQTLPSGTIKRIELSLFGGWFGGVTFLSLPPIAPQTTDLGASDILDFDGDPLAPPKYPGQIDATHKYVEDGYWGGITATFFVSDAFGLELIGAYGKSQAVVTGQYRDIDLVDKDHPFYDPSQDEGSFQWDQSDMSWIQGGVNMVYVFGHRKFKPYLLLGIGGLLNSFPNSTSTGALYFQYGGGFRYELSDALDVKLGLSSSLFTWDQDEVSLNQTVQYPMASLGLIWKYHVPPEVYMDEEPASEDTAEDKPSS